MGYGRPDKMKAIWTPANFNIHNEHKFTHHVISLREIEAWREARPYTPKQHLPEVLLQDGARVVQHGTHPVHTGTR